jgi:hypothetical protein
MKFSGQAGYRSFTLQKGVPEERDFSHRHGTCSQTLRASNPYEIESHDMTTTYDSQLANKFARIAALGRFGFLGFLGFLGSLGFIPGCERLFGLTGLSGFFGLFGFYGFYGVACYIERKYHRNANHA